MTQKNNMSLADKARALLTSPAALGRALGYSDLRDDLHGEWIRQMVVGADDMTLQAHRGSYKTTCLCIAIALMMLRDRDKNIIFLRKTDNDVAEVVGTVNRILRSDLMQQVYQALTGAELHVTRATNAELSTGGYSAPRGAAQLLGIGIGGSLTGKHADIIITDDIVNLRDRLSRAERERTRSIYQELQNIRNRGGRIINTGTPWHPDDAFALMPEAQRWDCYSTGLLDDSQIEQLRRSMLPSLFAANYELRHIASEDSIYRVFVNRPDDFIIDEAPSNILRATIGVDFGGGKSAHAFCCVGFTAEGGVVVLDEYLEQDALDPTALANDFARFTRACAERWLVLDVFCDSAEQTLINGLRVAAARERLPVNIMNARKSPINERIRATYMLMAAGRFKVCRNCKQTIDALLTAVWDSRFATEDKRLDDGSRNIDSLDAMEYAFERDIPVLIERWK